MKILVIRHAKTVYNEKELINGSIDDDELSETGLAQIPDIIANLEGHTFSKLYTSPMFRALQTATPIAEHFGLEITQDERLTEINLGSFNGQSWESTVPVFGVNSSKLLSSCEYDFTQYGGESANETKDRLKAFISDLKHNEADGMPLIICHGGIMRLFYYLATDNKAGRIPNGTLLELDF